MLTIVFFTGIFTSIISAVSGMGGGVLLLSALTFFYPPNIIIPIHGIAQLVSNSSRVWLFKNFVNWSLARPFMLGVPFGSLLGYLLLKKMNLGFMPYFVIIVLIIYVLLKPKKSPDLKLPTYGYFLLGVVTSFLSLLVGATGPLLAPFFVRNDFSKEEIVSTKASLQMLIHITKIPVFFMLDFDYSGYTKVIIVLSLAALLGSYFGKKILSYLNEEIFRFVFKFALFLSLVRMLYKILF